MPAVVCMQSLQWRAYNFHTRQQDALQSQQWQPGAQHINMIVR